MCVCLRSSTRLSSVLVSSVYLACVSASESGKELLFMSPEESRARTAAKDRISQVYIRNKQHSKKMTPTTTATSAAPAAPAPEQKEKKKVISPVSEIYDDGGDDDEFFSDVEEANKAVEKINSDLLGKKGVHAVLVADDEDDTDTEAEEEEEGSASASKHSDGVAVEENEEEEEEEDDDFVDDGETGSKIDVEGDEADDEQIPYEDAGDGVDDEESLDGEKDYPNGAEEDEENGDDDDDEPFKKAFSSKSNGRRVYPSDSDSSDDGRSVLKSQYRKKKAPAPRPKETDKAVSPVRRAQTPPKKHAKQPQKKPSVEKEKPSPTKQQVARRSKRKSPDVVEDDDADVPSPSPPRPSTSSKKKKKTVTPKSERTEKPSPNLSAPVKKKQRTSSASASESDVYYDGKNPAYEGIDVGTRISATEEEITSGRLLIKGHRWSSDHSSKSKFVKDKLTGENRFDYVSWVVLKDRRTWECFRDREGKLCKIPSFAGTLIWKGCTAGSGSVPDCEKIQGIKIPKVGNETYYRRWKQRKLAVRKRPAGATPSPSPASRPSKKARNDSEKVDEKEGKNKQKQKKPSDVSADAKASQKPKPSGSAGGKLPETKVPDYDDEDMQQLEKFAKNQLNRAEEASKKKKAQPAPTPAPAPRRSDEQKKKKPVMKQEKPKPTASAPPPSPPPPKEKAKTSKPSSKPRKSTAPPAPQKSDPEVYEPYATCYFMEIYRYLFVLRRFYFQKNLSWPPESVKPICDNLKKAVTAVQIKALLGNSTPATHEFFRCMALFMKLPYASSLEATFEDFDPVPYSHMPDIFPALGENSDGSGELMNSVMKEQAPFGSIGYEHLPLNVEFIGADNPLWILLCRNATHKLKKDGDHFIEKSCILLEIATKPVAQLIGEIMISDDKRSLDLIIMKTVLAAFIVLFDCPLPVAKEETPEAPAAEEDDDEEDDFV